MSVLLPDLRDDGSIGLTEMKDARAIGRGRFRGKKFEMVSTSGVALVRDVAERFMLDIFEMEPGDYLISDESSLVDFLGDGEAEIDAIHRRIREIYGVDVSNISGGNLLDIFVRISRAQ
jgi:hypothetical protein